MANNYSTLGFWRSWHRSYNLWIIRFVLVFSIHCLPWSSDLHPGRYIYIPLGGTRNLVFNTILVFSFVALWHDLTFRLLAWGWLVSFFILPELLASYLLPASRVCSIATPVCSNLTCCPFLRFFFRKFGQKAWYRHVAAIGAVANIVMMMAANLIGFVIGTDGIHFFVDELFGTSQGKVPPKLPVPCVCDISTRRTPISRGRMLLPVCRVTTYV